MIKLLAVLSILAGMWEVFKLLAIPFRYELTEDMDKFAKKAKAGKASGEDAKKAFNSFLIIILMLILETAELGIIVLGAVYFSSPLRWYIASLLLVSIIMASIPKGLRRYASYLDNSYSASVLIMAPLLLLR
jgi:hypothetical protein